MYEKLSEDKPGKRMGSMGKSGIALTIRICAFALLISWFFIDRDTNPKINIPEAVMPSPNAFDTFVAAGKAIVDDRKITVAFLHSRTPGIWDRDDTEHSTQEKSAFLKENAPVLAKLREGFAYPYQSPPARSFSITFPYFAKFRNLARLLVLEGQEKATRGDWGRSVQSDLDAFQIGEACPNGAGVIGLLVGIACEAIAREPLWDSVDHLNAKEAGDAASRLQKMEMNRVPYSEVMRQEKWGMQGGLMEQFEKRNWQQSLVNSVVGPGGDLGQNGRATLFFTSKRKIMTNFTTYMDKVIANADLPYAVKPPVPPTAKDPINSLITPVFMPVKFKYVFNATENSLLMTALALRAYQAMHGGYPNSLSQLVPQYLPSVPPDPFTGNTPLQYHKAAQRYVLYSVGPDGKDDGGQPILAKLQGKKPQTYTVQMDGLGDIVAGINK